MLELIVRADIRTMRADMPRAEAAIVSEGRFAFVGTEAAARSWVAGQAHRTLDAGGATLLPGFNDAHLHYLHYAMRGLRILLGEARSADEIIARMRREAKDGWIIGEGWNQEHFGQPRLLTREDLDRVSGAQPVIATRACGHIAAANSRALEIAGIPASGDGILREDEIDRVARHIPAPDVQTCVGRMVAAQGDLFAKGITSVQSDDICGAGEGAFLAAVQAACQAGRLRVRYAEQARMETPGDIAAFCGAGQHRIGGGGFHISCIKIMADGSLGARTASLRSPYADAQDTRGIALYDQETLDAMVREATRHGLPTAIHAIGDGAMQQVLDAIEAEGGGLRHAIVHAQISDAAQVARCGALGLCILAQPIFLDADVPIVRRRVGEALADTSYRWKTMQSLGAKVALSTDCPVEPFDPMPNLYCAITRRGLGHDRVYLPEEALTLDEALYAYTAAGAYASGEEGSKGCIAPGMAADYIVLDRKLEDGEPAALLETKVMRTAISGTCVYEA